MRKEVIVAILSGSLLGLVIAFGVWRANQAFKANVKVAPKEEKQATAPKENKEFGLTIASPMLNAISTSAKITFTGITRPNTFITASNSDEDVVVKADTKGSFTVEVSLDGGLNPIKVTSLDPNNGTAEELAQVVYSSDFKKYLVSESDTQEASAEADAVRQKVQEKLAEAAQKPTAYVGTVTDLTDKTMQVRLETGEVMQVSLSTSTEYTKTTGDNKKIAFKDVAIGDYVAALGFLETGEVLTGKRIIVTTKPNAIGQTAVYGKITKIDTKKKTLDVQDNKGTTWLIQFAKTWDGPNLTNVDEDEFVVVVGTKADSTLSSTRTLYLIEE